MEEKQPATSFFKTNLEHYLSSCYFIAKGKMFKKTNARDSVCVCVCVRLRVRKCVWSMRVSFLRSCPSCFMLQILFFKITFYLFIFMFYLFVCRVRITRVRVPVCLWKSEAMFRRWFPLPTSIRVPGIKLRSSGLIASIVTQ